MIAVPDKVSHQYLSTPVDSDDNRQLLTKNGDVFICFCICVGGLPVGYNVDSQL